MAEKKSKEKVEETKEKVETQEIKEKEEVKEDNTEETKTNSVEEKVEETKEKTEVEEPKTKEGEKTEDKTESDAETESEKTKEEDDEKSDKVTKDKSGEKSKEKKSLKDKILSKRKTKEKKDDKKEIAADENKDGYVSAREVVNSLDKDVKIIEKSEDEILANHVAEQLRENQDYFIFRIRKSIALMIVGLTIMLLWMIPLVPYLKIRLGMTQKTTDVLEQTVVSTSSAIPAVEESVLQRIKIKIDSESDKSASISSLLKSNGFSEVDIQEAEIKENGINVAVKKGDNELREKLMLILKDEYNAGSSSSELTDDSDFSAVILIGE